MKPLFFSLGNRLALMVIQDENSHAENTTILIDTYNIYKDLAMADPRQSFSKDHVSHLEKTKDPDYLVISPFKSQLQHLHTPVMEKQICHMMKQIN